MPRAVSIHIGVDNPRDHDVRLQNSENGAWRMAELASQAGYDRILALRGPAATRQAVHDALAGAAGALQRGDTLLVTFSGHGGHAPDHDHDERQGCDESWCLADGVLLDDKLAGYWRLFEPGARIVVVAESCYSGGMGRTKNGDGSLAEPVEPRPRVMRGMHSRPRGPVPDTVAAAAAEAVASCIVEPPRDSDEIHASVLMLTASSEHQTAEDGLFTRCLLNVWNGGKFAGSYCALYEAVNAAVTQTRSNQQPQILMLGAPDPAFPLAPAFRVDRTREPPRTLRKSLTDAGR
jgi:hypothetical protein